MKKTCKILAFLLIFSLFCSTFALAAEIPAEPLLPSVYDEYDVLTDAEEARLLAALEDITVKHSCAVAVAVIDRVDTYDIEAGADDFYDYNGYGYGANDDGILLLICMDTRDWAITTHGFAEYAFTNAALNEISSSAVSYLSDGDFFSAFSVYAQLCDEMLESARNGVPYGTKTTAEKIFSPGRLLGALLIGLFFAWITLSKHLKALKTVAPKQSATDYVKAGSLKLFRQRDIFLYHHLSVSPKPTSSSSSRPSSHISSSGRSHGGSHGKF